MAMVPYVDEDVAASEQFIVAAGQQLLALNGLQ
jgi:hypothetical protein